MFCTNCGKEIADDSVFCVHCGQKVEERQKKAENGHHLSVDRLKGGFKVYKNKKAAIGLGAAAAVVIVGITFGALYSTPKAAVAKGFQKTWKAVCKEETGLSAYLGANKLKKALETGKTRQSISGSISAGTFGMDLGDAGVGIVIDKNGDQDLAVNVKGEIAGMDFGQGMMYRDPDGLYVSCPDLVDGSFYLDQSQLKRDFSDNEYRQKLWNEYGIYIPEGLETDFDHVMKKVKLAVAKDLNELYQNMEVEKTEKKTFSIDGKEKKCQGYQVTVKKEDLKDVLGSASKVLVDEAVNYLCIFDSINGSWLRDNYGTVAEVADYYQPEIQELHQGVNQCTNVIKEDLVFDAYIGPKGRLTAVEAETEIPSMIAALTGMGGTAGMGKSMGTASASLQLLGGKNPLDQMNLEGTIDLNGLASISANVTRDLKDTKKEIQDCTKVILEGNGMNFISVSWDMELNGNLDKKTGEWKVDAVGSSPLNTASMAVEGTFSDVKKGKGFSVSLGDMDFDLRVFGIALGTIEPEFNYQIEPLKENMTNELTEGEVRNILEMSGDEWEAVFREAEAAVAVQGNVGTF